MAAGHESRAVMTKAVSGCKPGIRFDICVVALQIKSRQHGDRSTTTSAGGCGMAMASSDSREPEACGRKSAWIHRRLSPSRIRDAVIAI